MDTISLGDALFTKTQQKLLGLLYGRPGETFYLNEIVRLANVGKGTIKRELERMQAAGLVTVERIGNQNHYQANADCPIYAELLVIVRKTFGVVGVLQFVLEPLVDKIDLAFVYGSVARGSMTASSDIDLLVITDQLAYSDLMGVLLVAEELLGRPVNPSVYDMAQFKRKWRDGNAFVSKIMKQPKLWIKGSASGIKKSR